MSCGTSESRYDNKLTTIPSEFTSYIIRYNKIKENTGVLPH